MKRILNKKPYYSYGHRVKTGHFARQPKVRKTYIAIVFCVMTVMFTAIFSIINGGDRVSSSARRIATVSTKGKVGVSSPAGATKAKSAASSKAITSSLPPAQTDTVVSVPPKPLWVNSPLYVDPLNGAAQYVANNPSVAGASYISRMAQVPVAQWFGDWNTNVRNDVNSYVSAAAASGKVPVVVVYNIPNRDCGGYSTGGANGITVYTQWVQQVAAGIGGRTAVVVLEPDALGALDCLPTSAQQERLQSIAQAVTILKSSLNTAVYIDAGTPVWQPVNVMAQRLGSANVASADGFSLNVSYFSTTADNRQYGDALSSLIGYKHYVIDTSRNGGNNKPTGMQCNPSFASFGDAPTTNTGSALNDALLWIKIPWESDGSCNGSPGPGQEYWAYALQLAKNAGW